MARETLENIIIVEDEPDIREIEKLALEMIGNFKVRECCHGGELLEVLSDPSQHPQMILMDVMMPVMDGPSALKHIKSDPELQHLPVIFLTAKAMQSEIDRLWELGAAGVITKPFDPATLFQDVQKIWDGLED